MFMQIILGLYIYIYKLFMKTTEKMENNVFIKVESFYNINNKIVEQI